MTDLRMGDLCKDSSKADFIEQVTGAVFEVGQAAVEKGCSVRAGVKVGAAQRSLFRVGALGEEVGEILLVLGEQADTELAGSSQLRVTAG